jgi:hypothetical protein
MRHLLCAVLLSLPASGLAATNSPDSAAGGPADAAAAPLPAPASPAMQVAAGPDFLFGRPRWAIGLRGHWTYPRASSDWYEFVTDELTLERGDFASAGVAGDVAVGVSSRIDLVFGVEFANARSDSEFRHFVDNDRLPITQTTRLRHASFTAGARALLTERGRTVSTFSWVPHRVVPYVGGGGGLLWYRLEQYGDFVDFRDLAVFTDVIESQGWAPAVFVNAGSDVHLISRLYLTVDARYLWSSPDLDAPWVSFEPLDMTGFRLSTGLNIVF